MPEPITVTPAQIAAALDRAARYRRSLVPPEWQGKPNLKELVQTQQAWEPVSLGGGWFRIGVVLDTFADMAVSGLAVFWHPETDQVKVQRPPKPVSAPDQPKPTYTEHDFNRVGRKVMGYPD